MKKKKFTAFILIPSLILLLAASCTKEKADEKFPPVGYLRGNAYIIHTAVLNKPDGTARIYFRITGIDTANSTKADGFYNGADSCSGHRPHWTAAKTDCLQRRGGSHGW